MGICGSRGKSAALSDSILDRVTSQTSCEDDCLLYRLANYQKGGDLIDFFTNEGSVETEALIREQLPLLLYNKGSGQLVNKTDYLRWKYRLQNTVAVPIEAIQDWEDHIACWDFQYRGSLGETLLHVLIICDSKIHYRLARMLLKCFPRLALDIVEGEEFRGLHPYFPSFLNTICIGASALHLAIAYNNTELVKLLVEAGAGVNQRAIGTFFLPRDQQSVPNARHTDYEGLAYFGEYPLAWSACSGNEAVYNLLIDRGADPNMPDSFGNMVLHMVVVCDKLEMYGYALRHPRLSAKNGLENAAGLTPLTLACRLGRATVFREMMELTALEFWRYSNITCSAYPLNALDTIQPNGKSNWNSALMIILNGQKEEHLDMLDGGIIQRLLEEKWKTFARGQFLKRLIILFSHLFTLSVAVYLRPPINEELLSSDPSASNVARYGFEILTCLFCVSYIFIQQGSEILNTGFIGFMKQLSNNPAKFIFLISNFLTLFCVPCRVFHDRDTEEAILIFAVPGAWFFLMFFAGAVKLTGPFVTMIYSMITGDMLTFSIIYLVMILGFSQAFYFLHHGTDAPLFSNYVSTWMGLFQWTLGEYSYDKLAETAQPVLSKTVFVIFMVMVPILLLNMLIAMMGNTYALVIQQSEKEWVKQWAKIVIALERAVSQSSAKEYLLSYSIKLPGGGGDGEGGAPAQEMRGVMVIKSKNKTRARQRKGAVTNWKRVGKTVLSELKRRGIKGETLRVQIWDPRSDAPTPAEASPLKDVKVMNDGGQALNEALTKLAWQNGLASLNENNPTSKVSAAMDGFGMAFSQLSFTKDIALLQATESVHTALQTAPVACSPTACPLITNPVTQNSESFSDVKSDIIARNLLSHLNDSAQLLAETIEDPAGPARRGSCPSSGHALFQILTWDRPQSAGILSNIRHRSWKKNRPKIVIDPDRSLDSRPISDALAPLTSETNHNNLALLGVDYGVRPHSTMKRRGMGKKTNLVKPLEVAVVHPQSLGGSKRESNDEIVHEIFTRTVVAKRQPCQQSPTADCLSKSDESDSPSSCNAISRATITKSKTKLHKNAKKSSSTTLRTISAQNHRQKPISPTKKVNAPHSTGRPKTVGGAISRAGNKGKINPAPVAILHHDDQENRSRPISSHNLMVGRKILQGNGRSVVSLTQLLDNEESA